MHVIVGSLHAESGQCHSFSKEWCSNQCFIWQSSLTLLNEQWFESYSAAAVSQKLSSGSALYSLTIGPVISAVDCQLQPFITTCIPTTDSHKPTSLGSLEACLHSGLCQQGCVTADSLCMLSGKAPLLLIIVRTTCANIAMPATKQSAHCICQAVYKLVLQCEHNELHPPD